MARTPDRLGTFRVTERQGFFVLSGVDGKGNRVKLRNLPTRGEAETLGKRLCVGGSSSPTLPVTARPMPAGLGVGGVNDDWKVGIRVSPDTLGALNDSLGLNQPPAAVPDIKPAKDDPADEKRVRRAKQAKSMAEFIGVAYAAGDVWMARRIATNLGKEPVLPSPKQVNDLADVTKETLTQWFGDREIPPWQMMLLLSIGIPLTMVIQSPSKKKVEAQLKSVP